MSPSPPEPLSDHHDLDTFASGESILDQWLRRWARANQASGASRTFVICDGRRVVGYYALASGAVEQAKVRGRFRRNMPDPIPVVVLARMAVGRDYQNRGLGRGLFWDVARRVVQAADTIGIRGILVDAISERAKEFYIALGFDPCPIDPMTLVVTLGDLWAHLRPHPQLGLSS